jgi:hypothetical protein
MTASRNAARAGAGAAVLWCAVLLACAPAAGPVTRAEATGSIEPPLSPRSASYAIDARLDPASRTIAASATMTWRNLTRHPTSELQFHLYWNAWKNERSTFFREIAVTRPVSVREDDAAAIDVTALRLVSPATSDLLPTRRFVVTDGGHAGDETVMAVDLPSAVAPGEEIRVEVAWTARVPRTIARTGRLGDFYFIAHWFPKLGVLEDGGWNTPQFHASTEFYADFGVYDVRLTVPRGWTVGATGIERERVDRNAGTTMHRYYQEDVHDFAWTTSPDYVEHTAWYDPPAGAPASDRVHLRLLLQPEHAGQAGRHFDAARAALRLFGEWFGPYPYGHLTIVDPAYRSGADGMEYPTLVTAGTAWLVPGVVTASTPEEVTVHEIGHQWWQSMVGSNEVEFAWIDEGITTYATGRAMAEAFPESYLEERYFGGLVPWAFTDIRLSRDTYWNRRAGYLLHPSSDTPSNPSFRYHPATGRYISYNKTALWLHTAERWLGWSVMQRALRTFFERGRFSHPRPEAFFDALAEAASRDVTPFVDAVFRSSDVFDYGVESLRSAASGDMVRTSLIVRRYGEAVFPVDIVVTFADGERVTERWDGRERWTLYTYDRLARAVSAEVDPERVLLLDVDFTNNSMTLAPRGREAATRWSLKWMVWLQDALLTWAFFV